VSVEALALALTVRGLSPRAKLILIGLANNADKDTGQSFPSRRSLAEAGDCSVDTVDRAITELCDAGLVTKEKRDREGSKARTSNLYVVFPRRNIAAGAKMHLAAELPRGQPHSYAAPPAAQGAAPRTVIEPLEEVVSLKARARIASKEDINMLIARAGDACDPTAPGVHHGADLNRFLRGGCDWEADILPAVDRLAASFRKRGQRFSTWQLLEEAVVQNRDRRLAGLPAPGAVTEQPRRGGRPDASAIIDRIAAEMGLK